MKPRSTLFRKHLITFVGLAGFLLLASVAANLYFSWQDSRDALLELQRQRAEAAAGGIEQRLSDIMRQIGANLPPKAGEDAVAWREHELGLLRQAPAISDILLLDSEGREWVRVSRNGADAVGSKTDYSLNAAFQEAKSGQSYFSPVYVGGDNEPHITIAMAIGPEPAAVAVAEIDLRVLAEGLDRIAAGGRVVVVDTRGHVIALTGPFQKLQKDDAALLPAALQARAMVAPLGWHVSIEAPGDASLLPLSALVMRGAALLLAGLLLTVAAGIVLARRMTRPIQALLESAERIAPTALDTPDEQAASGGGTELEVLAERFKQLGAGLQQAHAQLERRVDERTLEAQEAQHEAERAHRRLAEMIEALPVAVYQLREMADGDFRFTYVCENARNVLGVSASEILADTQARWRTTLPEDRGVIEPVLKRAYETRQPADFHQRVQFDGATRWIRSYTSAPRQVDGGWVWNGCWLDETQARKREEEMRAGREQAQALVRTRSVFLSNVVHDIRTPLNAIIGLSHRALKDELTPPQFDCVSKIHHAGTDLIGIINNILDLARIDAGKLVLDTASFRLGQVIDKIAAAYRAAAADKGLTLTFDVPQNMPHALVGDPQRLEQILANLTGNAIKFTERGEVAMRVERVYSTDKQVMLRFLVRDTGIGMTAEQCERLFQGPLHEDDTGAREHGSIGLGLVLSKRLAEMMGGAIAVYSKPGIGSTFSFTARFGLGKERVQPAGTINGLRVLLVEDNALNQQVAAELLEGAGAQVDVAGNGRIALDKLKSDRQFDVVLMDLQMPEMDGFAATAALRADPAFAELPVLALTAHSSDQDRARCIDVGMNDHLTKPIVPRVLFDALKRWAPRLQPGRIAAAGAGGRPAPAAAKPPSSTHSVGAVSNRMQADGRAAGRVSKDTFQQLVGYLSSGDCLALDCFAAHRDELTSALGQQAQQLEQAIGRRDFETALSLLDSVMVRLDFGFVR